MNRSIHNLLSRSSLPWALVLLLWFVGGLAGCASQATHQGMVPETFEISAKGTNTVSLSVTGGQSTSAIGKPMISNEELKMALLESIEKSKVFSRVLNGTGGDYLLTVTLFSLEQPSVGFSMTVKMEAGWTLTRSSDNATVWQESIRSEYTAGVGEAFTAVKRLRITTEGAARNNIKQGLSKLAKLNL